jgi:hypothetical protein
MGRFAHLLAMKEDQQLSELKNGAEKRQPAHRNIMVDLFGVCPIAFWGLVAWFLLG